MPNRRAIAATQVSPNDWQLSQCRRPHLQEKQVAQSGEAWFPVQFVQTPVADTYCPLRHTRSAGEQSAAPGVRT